MEMYQASSTQQPAAICALKSPADAIHILEAVRLGLVPRVTRRLTGHERAMIRPGTVWVWEEEETNMRRWTDGRRWGASRVGGGGFLVYTESSDSHSPPPSRSESPFPPHGQGYYPGPTSSRRPESLIKQTYSTTMTQPATGKVKKFHVVAYSSKHNPQGDAHNPFPLPFQLPSLATLKVAPGIWPEWEHRRESDYPARRPAQSPFASSSQSAPVTAMSSPGGSNYASQAPPTAYPRPPSPRRDMFARPFPPPMAMGPYDPRSTAMSPRGPPPPPFQQQFQGPTRTHQADALPAGYDARHSSQPPAFMQQPPYAAERYHPYASRPAARVSYPPSPATSSAPSMGSNLPVTPHDPSMNSDRPRTSPTPVNPAYHSRPTSSSGELAQKPRLPMENSAQTQQYAHASAYGRLSPDNHNRNITADSPHNDPRRFPSGDSGMQGHARNVSAPVHLSHPARTSTSPNQPMNQLVPPRSTTPSGRSPKMSISSALLNQEGSKQGPGLTLPPLRVTMDDRDGMGRMLPSPGAKSPHAPSERDSPTDSMKQKGGEPGKGWGEDARQLGELGKRVVL